LERRCEDVDVEESFFCGNAVCFDLDFDVVFSSIIGEFDSIWIFVTRVDLKLIDNILLKSNFSQISSLLTNRNLQGIQR
jgi:hypothetical protein